MARAPKPSIEERAAERICPNCAGPVVRRDPRGPFPKFCGPACKRDHGNRGLVEGRAVVAFLKAWRADRGGGEVARGAFLQVCRITDQFNAQDRVAGRPHPSIYAAKLLADGTQFFDRQHQANAARARAQQAAAE